MLEGSYRRIYLVIYRVSGLAGLTPEVLNLLLKVIYTNRIIPLSFCKGIPSIVRLGNYPRVPHTLEVWGVFFTALVPKHITKPGLVEPKDRKGKQGEFQDGGPRLKDSS